MIEGTRKDYQDFDIWSRELTKIYGKRKSNQVVAVKDANLRVRSGVHGFLGPNGAGKTTTINMLIGALSITKGEAKIKGNKVGSVQSKKLIGFLPQDPNFYRNMTGEKYLMYMGGLSKLTKKKAHKKTKELLEYFDLYNDKDRKIKTYSGGMKQRLGLAAALISNPEILILDEPTANLDPVGRSAMIKKIKDLSNTMTVFVSSHILSEIEQMCDTVTVINKGEIILIDSIKNLKLDVSKNVFILDTDMNEQLLVQLHNLEFIESANLNQERKIQIIPKDVDRFNKEITKLVSNNDATLYTLERQKFSLQDIFTKVIEEDDAS